MAAGLSWAGKPVVATVVNTVVAIDVVTEFVIAVVIKGRGSGRVIRPDPTQPGQQIPL